MPTPSQPLQACLPDRPGPDSSGPPNTEKGNQGREQDERAVRRIGSDALFEGATEVILSHHGEDYRLRCTSKGKLILTK